MGNQESVSAVEFQEKLCLVGRSLSLRSQDVLDKIIVLTEQAGKVLDDEVEESFKEAGLLSTAAVAAWLSGESVESVQKVGNEVSAIFAKMAANREAPLNEVTKRCLRWSDSTSGVINEIATELEVEPKVLKQAMLMLQMSLNVTLVRMCELFENERQLADDRLVHMANHDVLTGLPNRSLILDRTQQKLLRARRNKSSLAAFFIDLDNFKNINDTLGHPCGDKLLRAVAARLQPVMRDIDVLGRLGGDEFVVVADDFSDEHTPEAIAERLLEALRKPFELEGHADTPLTVNASLGLALYHADECDSAEDLLRNADIAMYESKGFGGGQCTTFQVRMQDAIQGRMELEMDLRSALEKGEFFLAYQPIFDLQEPTPTPTGVEALLRWNSPKRGVVQPDDFVPLLEETTMIKSVGKWVMQEACRQGAEWWRDGYPIGVAVNVAAAQLGSDGFVAEVEGIIQESGFPAEALTIEITETAIIQDPEEATSRLSAIKSLGVRIAIDDFGSGYSSLSYLQKFPVDALKIDKSFILRLQKDPEGEKLVRTFIQLGKDLFMDTLAEGIERKDDLSFLQDENCKSGQGFLFARPMDSGACTSFLADALAADEGTVPTEDGLEAVPADGVFGEVLDEDEVLVDADLMIAESDALLANAELVRFRRAEGHVVESPVRQV